MSDRTKAIGGGLVGAGVGTLIGGPGAGTVYGFALGYAITNALFPPNIKSPLQKQQFDVTKAREGDPIPVVFGRRRLKGNVIFFDPKVKLVQAGFSATGDSGLPGGSGGK